LRWLSTLTEPTATAALSSSATAAHPPKPPKLTSTMMSAISVGPAMRGRVAAGSTTCPGSAGSRFIVPMRSISRPSATPSARGAGSRAPER
jgi:hypothetical protein